MISQEERERLRQERHQRYDMELAALKWLKVEPFTITLYDGTEVADVVEVAIGPFNGREALWIKQIDSEISLVFAVSE